MELLSLRTVDGCETGFAQMEAAHGNLYESLGYTGWCFAQIEVLVEHLGINKPYAAALQIASDPLDRLGDYCVDTCKNLTVVTFLKGKV